MTISPEKNDVDIRALFEYRKPVTLYGTGGRKETVHMRVIGDSELQRARVKALRASRELRNALKDIDSDEYFAYLPDISDIGKEKLMEMTILAELRSISKSVAEEIDIPFPIEPKSDAGLEAQEVFQKEVDEYPKKRESIVKREIIRRTEERKEELKKKSEKELSGHYIQQLVNELCELEMTSAFYDHVVYFSLYADEEYKRQLFPSFEDFDSLHPDIKETLLSEYRSLELGIDDLKK